MHMRKADHVALTCYSQGRNRKLKKKVSSVILMYVTKTHVQHVVM